MKTRQQQTDAFQVRTESGKVYGVTEITDQMYRESLSSSANGWIDGLKEYRVVGGGHANKKSDQEYEIVATGEIAIRI